MTRRVAEQERYTEQVATRLTPSTYARLQRLAQTEHRSAAAQVRLIVERHLQEEK